MCVCVCACARVCMCSFCVVVLDKEEVVIKTMIFLVYRSNYRVRTCVCVQTFFLVLIRTQGRNKNDFLFPSRNNMLLELDMGTQNA